MRILVAYDGSMFADAAIEDMRRAGLPEEAETLVLCVANEGLQPSHGVGLVETDFDDSSRERLAEAEAFAKTACDRIRCYFPRWMVSEDTLWGSPAKVILETMRWWRPDIIVAGTRGRSQAARLLLGSVSAELVHNAECSVRVTRRLPGVGPIRIVVGNDGSTAADGVIREVAGRSWPGKTEAYIVSVVETLVPTAGLLEASTFAHDRAYSVICEADEQQRVRLKEVADNAMNRLRSAGLAVAATVIEGDPRHVILEEANRRRADAIFVGARGLGRMERFLLGSVSTHVLTHAGCTVEVVR